jgi:peptidyl-prolyl cis-trans isomerase SurA
MKNPIVRLCCLLCLCWGISAAAAVQPIDRVVAVVNDDVITQAELDDQLATIKKQFARQNTRLPADAILKKQLLERMILRRIQLQMAARSNLRVDDDTLNRAIDNMAARNGLSLPAFRDAVTGEGMDFAKFREDMRDEIVISRLQKRQVDSTITVTEQEINNFLANQALQGGKQQEYHLGHILISVPEAASADDIAAARAKAQQTVAKLRGGADFSQTAIAESDGQQALQGGDLGWRQSGALPTLFADWVKLHQVGEVSDPIRSPSGFHVIKLLATRSDQAQHVVTQTHVRHILIRITEFTNAEAARTRILQLRQRLEEGEDFATLAKTHSEDPGSGVQGGDLGWVNPGEMVPPFEQAMNGLKEGEISQPVRSRFGWHLIQVLGRRSHDNTAEVQRDKARKMLHARKLEPALDNWLRRLRDESFVDIRL